MYEYFLPTPVRNMIDSIFEPPLAFLRMGIQYLSQVGDVAGRGISLNKYLAFFNYLPSSFQAVVNSLIASVVLLTILLIVKSIIRMYYAVKDGAQWW